MSRYLRQVVVDEEGRPLANAIGQIYAIDDVDNTSPLPVFDSSGIAMPLDQLKANGDGVTPEFNTPLQPQVKWVSGFYVVGMLAWDIIPEGGAAGQALLKNSLEDFDFVWASPAGLPQGGLDGQALVKQGTANFETRWETLATGGGGGTATGFVAGSVAYVRQASNGAWPVRPTNLTTVMCIWVGTSDWPAVVSSGVNGPYANDLLYEIKAV